MVNKLTEQMVRGADRMFAWVLIIFGYAIGTAMSLDTAGWDDPVFTIVHRLVYTPYSWAAILLLGTTVYMVGEVSHPDRRRWRGAIIIIGALMNFLWCMGMGLAMTRMVYVMPNRITDLWPLVMFFIALLYGTRIVVYANIFTGERWNTNPYQLWNMLFIMVICIAQVVIGIAPTSPLIALEHPVAIQIACTNLIGAIVVIVGLHLKDKETGLNLELAGGASLVLTLTWYCITVLVSEQLAATTIGFGLAEACTLATLHRTVQIGTLKWAQRYDRPRLEHRMVTALRPTETEPEPETGAHYR